MLRFYTIGHSSHAPDHLLALLREHEVGVLVDTRSHPYSKRVPHFDREALRASVVSAGLKYLFLGDVIGGRPKGQDFYDERGRVLYGKVAESRVFLEGIARLERGAGQFRVALLCSEEDPAHCHRRLLIGRVLARRGAEIVHIRSNGALQEDAAVAVESGKPIVETQPALFAEIDEAQWRSTASVLHKDRPASSSGR